MAKPTIIYGCQWLHIKTRREVVKLLRNTDKPYAAVVKHVDQFAVALSKDKGVCAASALLQHHANAIYVFALDDTKYYFCCTVDGVVYDGNDVVLSAEGAVSRAKRMLESMPELTLVTSGIAPELLPDATCDISPEKFSGLLAEGAKLVHKKQILTKWFSAVTAIPVLATVVGIMIMLPVTEQASLAEIKDVDTSKVAFERIMQQGDAASSIDALSGVLKNIDAKASGWMVSHINCVTVKQYCQFEYRQSGGSDNQDFADVYQNPKFDYNTKVAHITPILSQAESSETLDTKYNSLPSEDAFLHSGISMFQHIEAANQVSVSIKKPSLSQSGQYAYKAGKFTLNGKKLSMLFSLPYELSGNIYIESIDISFNNKLQASWKIGGYYVIKS